MMLYPAMNDLLKQVPSRYELVNVVAARARKIASQAEAENIHLEDKPVSIAVREIAQGDVPELLMEEEPVVEAVSEETPEAEPQEAAEMDGAW